MMFDLVKDLVEKACALADAQKAASGLSYVDSDRTEAMACANSDMVCAVEALRKAALEDSIYEWGEAAKMGVVRS